MSQVKIKIMKGIAAGLLLGGTIGALTVCAMKPKKSRFERCAGRALDAVGTMMQNISEWAF